MQSTHNPDFVRHYYTIQHTTQSYEIYQILKSSTQSLLTEQCRIEKFFGKSKASNIEKYFRLRTTTNWNTSEKVTGLREYAPGVYHGNRVLNGKKSFITFLINPDKSVLIVDYFRAYNPNTPGILKTILEQKKEDYKKLF